ncbi:MAG: peptidase M23 [Gammaproteobacteria bacterium SG8_47]|nr:MAG: peptidase M23 [Gammaproteobacteria bacterium SG8_47]
MTEQRAPIVVDFPLRGEWIAPNTPGHKTPSHGTDQLGQRYVFDFMRIDWSQPSGYKFFGQSMSSYFTRGVRLDRCFGYRQPIYAPFSGEIVEAEDGTTERDPVHFLRDMFAVYKNAVLLSAKRNHDLRPALGNYIVMKGDQACALFAHAHRGSIRVKAGENVSCGQQLAEVGHSGNSTAPHLHFHLMDSPQILSAEGLPCCFRHYELFERGSWSAVRNGIPGNRDRIRVLD